jgi:hypothetical protein
MAFYYIQNRINKDISAVEHGRDLLGAVAHGPGGDADRPTLGHVNCGACFSGQVPPSEDLYQRIRIVRPGYGL